MELIELLLNPQTLSLIVFALGFATMTLESVIPGGQFMVIGISLGLTGLLSFIIASAGLSWGIGAFLLLMTVMMIAFGAAAFYGYRELDIYGGKQQAQTSDSDTLLHTSAIVTETVTQQSGEIKLDEGGGFHPYFSATSETGETYHEGESVVVTDVGGGNILKVISIESEVEEIDRELREARESTTEKNEAVETESDN